MRAMHVDQPLCPGSLVQIIDILCDDQQVATISAPLTVKIGQCKMGGIGLDPLDRLAPHIVEPQHQIGVADKCFRSGNILDAVLLPQPAC